MNNCFLFWGPATMKQMLKLVAYFVLCAISTVLVILSPFYVLACKCYKIIPLEIQKYKEIVAKEKAEKRLKKAEKQAKDEQ